MKKNRGGLVYSTDGSHKDRCKNCKQIPCACRRPVLVDPSKTTLKIRIEKAKRGGKVVTVIHELPHSPDYFKDLGKKLKNHCCTGGTTKTDQIEIQGDHRERVKAFLEALGFTVKFSGG